MNLINNFSNAAAQFYQNLPSSTQVLQGIDYVGRGIGHTFCIIRPAALGAQVLLLTRNSGPILLGAGILFSVSMTIGWMVREIFDQLGILRNQLVASTFIWGSITLVGSTSLTAIVLVGCGVAESISQVFRRTFPMAGYFLFIAAFGWGMNGVIDDVVWNVPRGQQGSEWQKVFCCASAAILACMIGKGLRLFPSPLMADDMLDLLLTSLGVVGLGLAAMETQELRTNGPMTWSQLSRRFII